MMLRRRRVPERIFTGNCKIREHTGDGAYVGCCEHATYDGVCPRHGVVSDYPTLDDREVAVEARRFPALSDAGVSSAPSQAPKAAERGDSPA